MGTLALIASSVNLAWVELAECWKNGVNIRVSCWSENGIFSSRLESSISRPREMSTSFQVNEKDDHLLCSCGLRIRICCWFIILQCIDTDKYITLKSGCIISFLFDVILAFYSSLLLQYKNPLCLFLPVLRLICSEWLSILGTSSSYLTSPSGSCCLLFVCA